jgi:hypothetical protein
MTDTLPADLKRIFDAFLTTEYTTVDAKGQPITWPVTPYYDETADTVDVTTGLGYPKKATDARNNPKVALLFSDPTGCNLNNPPMVLVQGTADVDDTDLAANRERYVRESTAKLPGAKDQMPPAFMQKWFAWYFDRLYVKVRPERVYIWHDGPNAEPELLDSHMEEVRSGHDEEPDVDHPTTSGGEPVWDERMLTLGTTYDTAVLSLVCPDGFPFSVRVPVTAIKGEKLVLIDETPVGIPLQPGLACVTAHDHDDRFTYQRNFQVRGDLVEHGGGWAVIPRRMVGGFELPPGNVFSRMQTNFGKVRRFRKVAKKELAKREARGA